jgi:hypothetical protein
MWLPIRRIQVLTGIVVSCGIAVSAKRVGCTRFNAVGRIRIVPEQDRSHIPTVGHHRYLNIEIGSTLCRNIDDCTVGQIHNGCVSIGIDQNKTIHSTQRL